MRLACPICHAEYKIDERRVPAGGVNVRCPKCRGVFPLFVERPGPVPLPGPGGPVPAATERVPLPAPPVATPPLPDQTPPPSIAPPPPSIAAPPPPRVDGASSTVPAPAIVAAPAPLEPPPATAIAAPPPPAPLGFGEVDLRSTPVLGNEEPFPFDTTEMPFGAEPTAATSSAAAEPFDFAQDRRNVAEAKPAAPDVSIAPPRPLDDPFAVATPPPAGPDLAAPASPEPDAAPTDTLAMLAQTAPPDGSPAAEQVTADETLEALFEARSPAKAFSVRRRSGKVFGPFTEPQIVEMLSNGELLGNEEVAAGDSGTYQPTYQPITSHPIFGPAVQRLTDARTVEAAPMDATEAAKTLTATVPVREGLAGRARLLMRARRGGARGQWRWIALAAGLLVVLAIGAGAGFTRYGLFFHRVVRGQLGPQRPGAKVLAEARLRLAEDRFATVKMAVELADRALRIDGQDEEAKAVYTYSVSLLARRHGGGTAAWSRARGYLPVLTKHAGDDPEAAKAVLAAALLTGDRPPEAAAAMLERYLAKTGARDGDALLVMADASLAAGDVGRATELSRKLEAVQPASARASHALGLAASRRGDRAGAQQLFEAALSLDAQHFASAVEVARLALAAGDRDRADALAKSVLAAGAQSQTGPRERARARTVVGLVLARSMSDEVEGSLAAAERELEAATREDGEDVEPRVALASFQLDRDAAEKAKATLAPILSGTPRDARVIAAQARVMAAQGRFPDAAALLDAALEKSPGDARLLQARGLVASDAGKQADADRLWVEAAARDATAFEPHLAISQARLQRGDLEGSEKELKLASERAPADPRVLSTAADLLLARRDLAGAEAAYRRALAIDGAHGEAHLGLARIALDRGEAAQAQRELERSVVIAPRLAAAQALYGEVLWKARDLTGARKALQAAVALDPNDAMSQARLGAIELLQGDRDSAVAHLQSASRLAGGSAEVRAWYGRALMAKGDLQGAIEQLRKSVDLDPRDALVHLELGQALERVSSAAEAAEAYRAAQVRAPQMVETYEALGGLYSAQNRCGDALPQLEKAVALAPRVQRLRVAVADCKVRLGRYADAVTVYRRVLDADPKQVSLYYKIARAQHEATGPREALPWYERAAREEPGNPMPHYYLAFLYKERGQAAKAIAAFRGYLRTSPNADDRKDIEQEIEDLGGTPEHASRR